MTPSWDASMETGYAAIDRQHRDIIGLVDDLTAAEGQRVAAARPLYELLGRVMDFTVAHFTMEEDLMRRVDYPPEPTREMIDQHREFTSYARLRVLEFRAGDAGSVVPLQSFLREWLVSHEFGLDRKLVQWIRQREGTPAR